MMSDGQRSSETNILLAKQVMNKIQTEAKKKLNHQKVLPKAGVPITSVVPVGTMAPTTPFLASAKYF